MREGTTLGQGGEAFGLPGGNEGAQAHAGRRAARMAGAAADLARDDQRADRPLSTRTIPHRPPLH
ncbi:MAG: hypothetical protein IVW57_14085 [Ktedonobacterales bacterium]|nr:hypothetical protein [Ktedonobacterales bacterium]